MSVVRRATGGAIILDEIETHRSDAQILRTFGRYFEREAKQIGGERYGDERLGVDTKWIIDAGGRVHFFMLGVQAPEGFLNIGKEYVRVIGGNYFQSVNRAFGIPAQELYQRQRALRRDYGNQGFSFFGHSAGGGVCEVLIVFHFNDGGRDLELHTYGTPKIGFRGTTLEPPNCTRFRWMNSGDPVPLLPSAPIGSGAAIALVFGAAYLVGNYNLDMTRFQHGSGGRLLRNGRWTERTDAGGLVNPYQTIEDVLAGDADAQRPHFIGSYATALRACDQEDNTGGADERNLVLELERPRPQDLVLPHRANLWGHNNDIVMPFPLPFNVPAAAVGVARVDAARQQITFAGTTRGAAVGVREMANAKMARSTGWTRAKIDTNWYVYLAGVYVAKTRSGSKAKTMCKRGNAMLRYMSNISWSGPEVPDAFQEFINRAVAGNGYSPPLDAAG